MVYTISPVHAGRHTNGPSRFFFSISPWCLSCIIESILAYSQADNPRHDNESKQKRAVTSETRTEKRRSHCAVTVGIHRLALVGYTYPRLFLLTLDSLMGSSGACTQNYEEILCQARCPMLQVHSGEGNLPLTGHPPAFVLYSTWHWALALDRMRDLCRPWRLNPLNRAVGDMGSNLLLIKLVPRKPR